MGVLNSKVELVQKYIGDKYAKDFNFNLVELNALSV
jgi:hypothetical protein